MSNNQSDDQLVPDRLLDKGLYRGLRPQQEQVLADIEKNNAECARRYMEELDVRQPGEFDVPEGKCSPTQNNVKTEYRHEHELANLRNQLREAMQKNEYLEKENAVIRQHVSARQAERDIVENSLIGAKARADALSTALDTRNRECKMQDEVIRNLRFRLSGPVNQPVEKSGAAQAEFAAERRKYEILSAAMQLMTNREFRNGIVLKIETRIQGGKDGNQETEPDEL